MHFPFHLLTLAFLFLTTSLFATAQTPLDTLNDIMNQDMIDTVKLKLLQDEVWANHRDNSPKALMYNDSAMALARRMHNLKGIQASYYYYGVIYKFTGQYDQSLSYLNTYVEYADSTNNQKAVADGCYQTGVVADIQGASEKSLEYYHKALSIYRELDDTNGIGFTLSSMGSIYKRTKQYEKAIAIYKEAMALNKKNNRVLEIGYNYNNIGSIYGVQGQLDTALVYFSKYLEIAQQMDKDYEKGFAYENIGRVYQGKKRYDLALEYFQKSLALREKLGHLRQLSTTISLIGNVQMSTHQYRSAIQTLNKGLELARQQNLKPQIQTALQGLSDAHQAAGNFQEALVYHQRYTDLKDSLLNEKITKQLAEMDARFESAQKEKEIALLGSQNQIQELNLEKANRQKMLIGLVLLAALLILGLLYYFFHQKQKDNAIISHALKEKELLLREIHHRVKNNLQVISSLLDLQSAYIQDEAALKAIKQGRDRVHSMALIHQNLYQEDNLIGIAIQTYFDQLIHRLFNSYNVSPERIKLETRIDDIQLDVDTLIPLGLITNELVSNALKHAFPSERPGLLKISLREEQQQLILEVTDDGIGFNDRPEIAIKSSFGYRLINAFKNRLKADLEIKNQNGSQIILRIGEYQKVA